MKKAWMFQNPAEQAAVFNKTERSGGWETRRMARKAGQ